MIRKTIVLSETSYKNKTITIRQDMGLSDLLEVIKNIKDKGLELNDFKVIPNRKFIRVPL